jgi:hypothetical protein
VLGSGYWHACPDQGRVRVAHQPHRRQGWYAADRGPQNALYVPGALLRPCANEVVLLELNRTSFTVPSDVPAGAAPQVQIPSCKGVRVVGNSSRMASKA